MAACAETLEPLLNGQTVTLVAPSNNVTSSDTVQTFYWQPVTSAVQYQLQIVTPRFDSIVTMVADTVITTTDFSVALGQGTYQWRVQAMNNSTSSQYSAAWNLTVQ